MFGKRAVFQLLLGLTIVALLSACGATPTPVPATVAPTVAQPPTATCPVPEDLLDQVTAAGKLLVSTDPTMRPELPQ